MGGPEASHGAARSHRRGRDRHRSLCLSKLGSPSHKHGMTSRRQKRDACDTHASPSFARVQRRPRRMACGTVTCMHMTAHAQNDAHHLTHSMSCGCGHMHMHCMHAGHGTAVAHTCVHDVSRDRCYACDTQVSVTVRCLPPCPPGTHPPAGRRRGATVGVGHGD